jgi:hypothetical protein
MVGPALSGAVIRGLRVARTVGDGFGNQRPDRRWPVAETVAMVTETASGTRVGRRLVAENVTLATVSASTGTAQAARDPHMRPESRYQQLFGGVLANLTIDRC